jgi:trans-aconitate 2-methyltransferase
MRKGAAMSWDPSQYLKFAGHRLRPAIDLLNRIPMAAPERIVDLGCGTGNVTRLLEQRWPSAQLTGIDSSADMLARSNDESPSIAWQAADIGSWQAAQPVDLLYSNAALHWLGDHQSLFHRLFAQVRAGGFMAVQMPRNFAAPSHATINEMAEDPRWHAKLSPLLKPAPTQPPSFYYDVLGKDAASLDIWETEYLQALEGEDAVAEWTKGTWLRPFLDALDGAEQESFENAYRARMRTAYPRRPDGRTLFPFRRLFLIAERAA